jgi:hypothetical protein
MPGRRLAVVVALALAVPAGAGCGSDAPRQVEVVPGKRAGVVVEAAGTVTATRSGQAARALRAGDEVSGDDEIQTGADGSVLVELDHNHVTFSLPANRTQRVGSSPAWTQPIAAARPVTTDEHSAAAGRPVERAAVDTSVSAAAPAAPAAAPTPPPMEEQPSAGAVPKPERIREKGAKPSDEPVDRAPPPEPTKNLAQQLELKSGGGGGGGGNGARERGFGGEPGSTGAAAAAAPMNTDLLTVDSADGTREGAPLGTQVTSIAVKGGLTRDEIVATITTAPIDTCWTRAATITIEVAADGAIQAIKGDKTIASCVTKALDGVKLPAKRKKSTVTLSR